MKTIVKRVGSVMIAAALLAGLLGLGVSGPAHAQNNAAWNVEYFDNAYLTGTPVQTARVSGIGFNWDAGAAGVGLPNDNWSARFGTDIYFRAGTYRFYILADDAAKLVVDFLPLGQVVVNTFDDPRPGELQTADVQISDGQHHLQVDFREYEGVAFLYVDWEPVDGSMNGPNFPAIPITVQNTAPWTGEYYANTTLYGLPALTQTESTPSHEWGQGSPGAGVPADNWSARFTTAQYLDAGTYTANVRADDGVRVFANGQLILNEWHGATGQTYTGTFTVGQGFHALVVEYYDDTLNASLDFRLTWTYGGGGVGVPTGARATITAWMLNVRATPVDGAVLVKVPKGGVYDVLGVNAARTWWLIDVNGVAGWVSATWVTVENADAVPVTDGANVVPPAVPTATPYYPATAQCPGFLASRLTVNGYGRVLGTAPNNARIQPSTTSALVGQIPVGAVFTVISGPICDGRTAWWQVNYAGIVGWTMEGDNGVYWLEPYVQ